MVIRLSKCNGSHRIKSTSSKKSGQANLASHPLQLFTEATYDKRPILTSHAVVVKTRRSTPFTRLMRQKVLNRPLSLAKSPTPFNLEMAVLCPESLQTISAVERKYLTQEAKEMFGPILIKEASFFQADKSTIADWSAIKRLNQIEL